MPTTTAHHSLADRLRRAATLWARSQHELVTLAADFADSGHWALDGSPTAAHWLAAIADVETWTTREWIRIGRALRTLPATADAFATHQISYAKVRNLTRLATPNNETCSTSPAPPPPTTWPEPSPTGSTAPATPPRSKTTSTAAAPSPAAPNPTA